MISKSSGTTSVSLRGCAVHILLGIHVKNVFSLPVKVVYISGEKVVHATFKKEACAKVYETAT